MERDDRLCGVKLKTLVQIIAILMLTLGVFLLIVINIYFITSLMTSIQVPINFNEKLIIFGLFIVIYCGLLIAVIDGITNVG